MRLAQSHTAHRPDPAVAVVHRAGHDDGRCLGQSLGARHVHQRRPDDVGCLRHLEERILWLSQSSREVSRRQRAALVVQEREHVEAPWLHELRGGPGDVWRRRYPGRVAGDVLQCLARGELVHAAAYVTLEAGHLGVGGHHELVDARLELPIEQRGEALQGQRHHHRHLGDGEADEGEGEDPAKPHGSLRREEGVVQPGEAQ